MPSPNDPATDIQDRISRRVSELRNERGYSLEMLAARSGVSRSMISRIERDEVSPTAAVLNRLAIGLGVLLPTLFGFAVRGPARPLSPVTKRCEQPCWKDPENGYQRRILTPPGHSPTLQLSEVYFPPGARVTFENALEEPAPQQQVWVLKGEMAVLIGEKARRIGPGDCLIMTLDQPVTFHNPGHTQAHYLVAHVAGAKCP